MTFVRFLQAIPLAAVLTSRVWALSNMAGCPAGFDWNKNSLGQDPCEIASMLDASCRGLAAFTIPPLNGAQYYPPPGADTFGDVTCDCNTVMYSLYMACTSCQGGQVYSWMQWIPQCGGVRVMWHLVDITQEAAIPHWAYYDIMSLPSQTWDDTIAMDIGRNLQVMPRQVDSTDPPGEPTGTSSSTTSTPPTTQATPSTTTSTRSRPLGYSDEGGKPSTENQADPTTTEDTVGTTPTETSVGSTADSPAIPSTTTSPVVFPTNSVDKPTPIASSVESSTIANSMEPTTHRQNGGNGANFIVCNSIGSMTLLLILAVLTFI